MKSLTEKNIETYAIEQLRDLGWEYVHGISIAPGAENQERENFEQVLLTERLKKSIGILNPHIPEMIREKAIQQISHIYSSNLLENNEMFHRMLVEKVKIPYLQDGFERSHEVALIDFENPLNNQFLVVNQYTIVENGQNKRPDLLLFINGIPLVIVELKNAVDENATIEKAFNQIATYIDTIPSLFTYNAICVLSDGHECKAGSLSAGLTRYMAWKSIDGVKDASRFRPQLETLFGGMLNHSTVLDLTRNYIVFEKTQKGDVTSGLMQTVTEKKLAAYHQYYAVNKAVESTLKASATGGNKKGGVVWHTQGSGKSLSMVFYAGKLITTPDLLNPTILVITDRNDLDDQLFGVFVACKELLRQTPIQAESREDLKNLLSVSSGGVVFTTIQKFLPEAGNSAYDELSSRKNIIVLADEAHRTQYGFEASAKEIRDKESKEIIGQRITYGFAKYLRDALPNATYIGFTGTPIESTDVNTPKVFGQYIDIYDISRAVNDGATVRIYYESRLAKVYMEEEGKKLIEAFDQELEQEELSEREKAKAKWSRLESIVGNTERLKNLALDIITHFEARQQAFDGKAMIVTMSRRIAAELYKEIITLRPGWHHSDLNKGMLKIVMTASSADGPEMQRHHTTKTDRKLLADRMKDESDDLKLVIVRDMWLTGFDAPCLKTLYIDKPMRGHNLMQAIARVNRIFKDVKGGLVVDYLGIATDLKKALSFYAEAGGKGNPAENIEAAIRIMQEKRELVTQMFHEESHTRKDINAEDPLAYYENSPRFNYRRFFISDAREKLSIILQAEEHILGLEDGKQRFIREVTLLTQAFILVIPHEEAMKIKEEVAFFQAVKARLVKFESGGNGTYDVEMETAIKQLVDRAIASDQVIDIFDAAGIKKPDISILSEDFLYEVQDMKHKNLALELLKKVLNNEIKSRAMTNLVKSRVLLEMLERSIKKYQNNLLTTAEIIQELIQVAREVKKADEEGKRLGLSDDEKAFYDALEANDSAVKVLGDHTLRGIAMEIADKVRNNTTIDWMIRESARAKLMVLVRRTLTKYGYPPDKQEQAIELVIKQAELMANYLSLSGK